MGTGHEARPLELCGHLTEPPGVRAIRGADPWVRGLPRHAHDPVLRLMHLRDPTPPGVRGPGIPAGRVVPTPFGN